VRRLYEDPRFAGLISALELIAAEPEQQRPHVNDLLALARQIQRGEPIELIDEVLVREGVLPAALGARIKQLDALFDQLLARSGELTCAALLDAPEWTSMRALARETLAELGVGPELQRAPTTRSDT
jgi:hypothetical protein